VAEFFSFGTNDLTQTTFGISRDDASSFLMTYQQKGIIEQDPFVTLDIDGVGELVRIASDKGRATRPDIKLGICGEHGGDPASVKFCESDRSRLCQLLALPRADRPPWPPRRRRSKNPHCLTRARRQAEDGAFPKRRLLSREIPDSNFRNFGKNKPIMASGLKSAAIPVFMDCILTIHFTEIEAMDLVPLIDLIGEP
jgi:hypothetical protein